MKLKMNDEVKCAKRLAIVDAIQDLCDRFVTENRRIPTRIRLSAVLHDVYNSNVQAVTNRRVLYHGRPLGFCGSIDLELDTTLPNDVMEIE